MSTPAPRRLLGQFEVTTAVAMRAFAGALRRASAPASGAGVVPILRQATIVSADGGTPSTVTITFDGTKEIPGIRYLAHYTPTPGDVVEVVIRAGDPTVWGVKAP
jgi:hypothetical protein